MPILMASFLSHLSNTLFNLEEFVSLEFRGFFLCLPFVILTLPKGLKEPGIVKAMDALCDNDTGSKSPRVFDVLLDSLAG